MLQLGIVATHHVQNLIQELSRAVQELFRVGQLLFSLSRCGLASSVGQFIEDALPVMRKTLCTWLSGFRVPSNTLTKKGTKVRYALPVH